MDKAWSIVANHPHDLILGSDTVIEIDETLLGKPEDLKEAEIMLRQLRGRCHQVHTGIALIYKARDFSLALVETALVWETRDNSCIHAPSVHQHSSYCPAAA